MRGIHRSPVDSPHRGQRRGSLGFFFDLRLNKRLRKHWRRWWFETPSRSLWRQCDVNPWRHRTGHIRSTVRTKGRNLLDRYLYLDALLIIAVALTPLCIEFYFRKHDNICASLFNYRYWVCAGGWNPSGLMEDRELVTLRSQWYCCWYPGDARSQGISSHGIDIVL